MHVTDTQRIPAASMSSQNDKAMASVLCSVESCGTVSFWNKRLQHHGASADTVPALSWSTLWITQAQRGPVERDQLIFVLPKVSQMCWTRGHLYPAQGFMGYRIGCSALCKIKGPHGGLASVGGWRNLGPIHWCPVSNKSTRGEQMIEKLHHGKERNPPCLKW